MNAEKLNGIAKEIKTALSEVTKELAGTGARPDPWTKKIMMRICTIGKEHNYYICASSVEPKPNHGEWLYDVCWLDWKKKDPPRLKQVVLAAECEWGNDGDIYDDFEKLVQSRARLRVMIFTKKNEEAVNGMIDDLKACASGFEQRQPGDDYLFCGYDNTKSGFIFKRWQVS